MNSALKDAHVRSGSCLLEDLQRVEARAMKRLGHVHQQCFVNKGPIEDVYAAYEAMQKEEA